MFTEQRSIDYIRLREQRGELWHPWPIGFGGDAHLATLVLGVLGILLGGADVAMWLGLPLTAVAYWLACRPLDSRAAAPESAKTRTGLDRLPATPLQRIDWQDTH
jgi:hypothetical protein